MCSMNHTRAAMLAFSLTLLVGLIGCGSTERTSGSASAEGVGNAQGQTKNEVIVLGTIHAYHYSSKVYSLNRLQEILRAADPDYVMIEVPPDRLEDSLQEFRVTGEVTDPRVKLLLEYTGAVFPLAQDEDFELIPVSAWNEAMADDRRTKLRAWRETRPDDSAVVQAAQSLMLEQINAGGLPDDPAWIHTESYDRIVKSGQDVLSRVFNDDLGAGGWENHNNAHYELISEALDKHRGEGKRFVLMFAAVHKYWFTEKLRERDDIELLSVQNFLQNDGS